jgi:hypothetical protein
MADDVYKRLGIVSLGTTVSTAPHLHRNRRTCSETVLGAAPAPDGPRNCRSRRPCPTIPRSAPGGQPACPHTGQVLGLSRSTLGTATNQSLTPTLPCTIV